MVTGMLDSSKATTWKGNTFIQNISLSSLPKISLTWLLLQKITLVTKYHRGNDEGIISDYRYKKEDGLLATLLFFYCFPFLPDTTAVKLKNIANAQ